MDMAANSMNYRVDEELRPFLTVKASLVLSVNDGSTIDGVVESMRPS